MGSFFEKNVRATFFTTFVLLLNLGCNLEKIALGDFGGEFFTNASGHPGLERCDLVDNGLIVVLYHWQINGHGSEAIAYFNSKGPRVQGPML
jgi:hypothetical protein